MLGIETPSAARWPCCCQWHSPWCRHLPSGRHGREQTHPQSPPEMLLLRARRRWWHLQGEEAFAQLHSLVWCPCLCQGTPAAAVPRAVARVAGCLSWQARGAAARARGRRWHRAPSPLSLPCQPPQGGSWAERQESLSEGTHYFNNCSLRKPSGFGLFRNN